MSNKPVTYYVLEPRDEPCKRVNPRLWQEFTKFYTDPFGHDDLYTEAFCVQWLDMYHYDESRNVICS